ncbi:MAG: SusC/RagA family protein [Sphingobacteriales bacterium 17-39-43]|uniref:SusC/RagA family TonB-linked outer membrane protein n=1 Tax=Daejeonella sp. TaxID=2805397 RepID=UPI000BC918B5|nr:SusC/RagA family TonB-linked outer membrane protein [Daejeonella sp.]MCF8452444.1 SusC/RagA family TonB-linked outer membrane protein [Pedobacter sp.]OYZ28463.1 MAG: SusC/RagA family protein [Sphingobacteriales bacterium 16-39-50]OZA22335.1 MAG: SusC/RagA family protein [Sphingobacteriales bacterium 17-39-43]HQS50697.1 SusC/RagA family TonB-linked outer membrane protein [Daejeonella sp.]HQT24614.1 SusC/RagA family TonB-linked outer membrane protein [Daejeonella sp.]
MKNNYLRCLSVLMFTLLSISAFAQKTITGTVRDNSAPLPGVSVTVKGTIRATQTDAAGKFSISASPTDVLVFTMIGSARQEITVGNQQTIDVTLTADESELGEVVITALGIKREKKSLGYGVQEVKGETLVSAKESNLANTLTGKVAGLQVIRSSDGPAGSSKILLRGSNSLTGSNQPLIVVDGVPIDNFTGAADNGYWNRSLDMGNGIADINPDDIETLSVLKGPSAAALYGSRAGNGVILITTKSGRAQDGLGITTSSSYGMSNIFTNPELQNTFGQGNTGVYNATSTQSWGPKAEGQMVTNWNGQQVGLSTYDNVDSYMQQGTNINNSISFQQMYKGASIYTSYNRLEDEGIVPGTKLLRNNLTARAVSKFGSNDRWVTDTKIQYSNTKANNRPIGGRDNSSAYTLYLLPRSMNITEFQNATNNAGNMLWFQGAGSQVNPYWSNQYNLNQDSRDRFIVNGSVKYNFNSWLNAEVKGGADLYTTNTQSNVFAGSPIAATGRYGMGKQTFSETNFSTLISARKDNLIGKFGGMLSVGGNLMQSDFTSLSSSVGLLVVPNLFSLNNGVSPAGVSQGISRRRINSIYSTAQISYNDYLFLDATFRNDWSSTLSPQNRSFFYPSVSLSYVFSDMLTTMGAQLPNWFSFGKLRASYAQVGNDLAPYQLYNTFNIGKDPNGNTTAGRNSILLDPNVRSELIKSLELGTEMRFLQGRIGLDFSYYKTNATRQLINLPMDALSGYTARKVNAGDIQNTGFELVVDGRVFGKPGGLNWNTSFNYSRNNNTVEELSAGVTRYNLGGFDDVAVLAVVGQKYGEIYGTRYSRVKDQTSPFFGQVLLNANGVPTRDPEIVRLGNQQAKALIGFTNSFEYKGVGLSFLVDARIGGEIFSATHVALQARGAGKVTAPNGLRESFVPQGVVSNGTGGYTVNTKAVTPQEYWLAVATANNLGISEANIYDASNVRLRNVQLNYTLSRKLLANSPIKSAKFGVSANNVWLIKSHMNGIDPESVYATNSNATGFENAGLPTMRTILINLALGF